MADNIISRNSLGTDLYVEYHVKTGRIPVILLRAGDAYMCQ